MTEPHPESRQPEPALLPDTTSDEQEIGWGDDLSEDAADDDARLTADRPPHYDRG